MIPDLLLSRLSQEDYMRALSPSSQVYEPINKQLYSDYEKRGRERLLRLRDYARAPLWKDLHEDWLPNLQSNPSYIVEFENNLRRATTAAAMGPLFDAMEVGMLGMVSLFSGYGVGKLASLTGLDPGLAAAAGTVAGGYVKNLLDAHRKESGKQSQNLTLFLQKANRI